MSARLFTDEAPKISFCTQKFTCNDNHSVMPYVINVNTATYVRIVYGSQPSSVVNILSDISKCGITPVSGIAKTTIFAPPPLPTFLTGTYMVKPTSERNNIWCFR